MRKWTIILFLIFLFKFSLSEKNFILKEDLKGIESEKYLVLYDDKESKYYIKNQNNELEEVYEDCWPYEKEKIEEIVKKCSGKERETKFDSILYLGPTFLIYKYLVFANKKKIQELYMDPVSLQIVNVSLFRKKFREKRYQIRNNFYLEIEDLKPIDYYISGNATSIGIILNFWFDKGYKNLKKEENIEGFVREINKACLSCLEGPAIEIFTASRGYAFKTKIVSDKEDFLTQIINEIKGKRPVLIQISSSGISHYGVLTGVLCNEDGIFGKVFLPINKGKTKIIYINLFSKSVDYFFTSVMPFK